MVARKVDLVRFAASALALASRSSVASVSSSWVRRAETVMSSAVSTQPPPGTRTRVLADQPAAQRSPLEGEGLSFREAGHQLRARLWRQLAATQHAVEIAGKAAADSEQVRGARNWRRDIFG